jgi:large subunit ribosomal protein L25
MMRSETLNIENRTGMKSRANNRLRQSGYLPGTICSKEIGSVSVVVKRDELQKALTKSGKSTVFKLKSNDGKTYNAMIKDIQLAPINREYLHVSFHQVSLTEETKAEVAIKFEGKESLEARRLVLIHNIEIITVKGLPHNIPNSIDIDVSNMQAGDNLHISDIKFPKGIVTEMSPEQVVISVTELRIQEEKTDVEDSAVAE